MKAKITHLALTLLAVFWLGQNVNGQITVSIPTITACPGTTISIPIMVDGTASYGINALNFILQIDNSVLQYTSYTSNPALSGGMTTIFNPAGNVSGAWFGLSSAVIANGTALYTLNFTYLGGSCNLVWDLSLPDNCQFSDISNPIPSTWNNGSISPAAPTPLFTSQPASVAVNDGDNTSFSVTADNATTYLWQVSNNGTNWNNLAEGGYYSGTTTSTLNITGAALAMNNYQFRCIAGETVCNQAVNSDAATLTVNSLTSNIIVQAGTVTNCPADNWVTIPVNVTDFNDVGSFSLNMTFNPAEVVFVGIQNVNPALSAVPVSTISTSSSITLDWSFVMPANVGTGLLLEMGFNYIGGNADLTWTQATSAIYTALGQPLATTYVNGAIDQASTAPVFNQHPNNTSTMTNNNATFTANAPSASSYSWYESTDNGLSWNLIVDGGNYSGATTSTLTIVSAPFTFNGNLYRCEAMEAVCSLTATSNAATLTVTPSTTDIVTTVGNSVACPDPLNTILIPVDVTNFYNVASANMIIFYDTTALIYDTVANVHPDLTSGVFTAFGTNGQFAMAWFAMVPSNLGTGKLFDIAFYHIANSTNLTYDLINPGACAYTDILFNELPAVWVNGSVSLPGPVITTMPTNQTAFVGTNAVFSLTATNTTGYQWQMKTAPNTWTDLVDDATYSGVTTNTLTISNTTLLMDGSFYRCNVDGQCGIQHSYEVELAVINGTPIEVTLPTLTQCQAPLVIPINANNFTDVGKFKLVIHTTGNTLLYTGYQNMNSQLAGLVTVTNATNAITIQGNFANPISLGSPTIVELKFNTMPGTTPFEFSTTAGDNYFKSINNTVLPSTLVSGSVTINSFPGPPTPIQGLSTICQGVTSTQYSTLGANNATSYIWSIIPSNAGTITANGLTATVNWDPGFTGVATITVKGVNACGNGSIITKTITIVLVPIVGLANLPDLCTGDTLPLTGGTPVGGTYSGTGVSNGVFYTDISGPGTFIVTYTYSSSGCSASATNNITVNPTPVVTYNNAGPYDTVSPYYPTFALSGGMPLGGTYSGMGVNSGTGMFGPSAPNGWRIITYTYTTSEGCTASAKDSILIDPILNMNLYGNVLSMGVQPNPTTGVVKLVINNVTESFQLDLFNNIGQKVMSEFIRPDGDVFMKDIDLSNQPKGLYYLKASSGQIIRIEKIVVN